MAAKRKLKADAPFLAILRAHGFPRSPGPGLCATSDGDALYARGYPELRLLDDARVPERAAVEQAETALESIDPVLRICVTRDVARRYLLGYCFGPNLASADEDRAMQRAEAIRSPRDVDLALLRATLANVGARAIPDTYARWRLPEVLYLFEAFLGSDVVARVLADHVLERVAELEKIAEPSTDPVWLRAQYADGAAREALSWMLRRVTSVPGQAIRADLAKLRDPRGTDPLLAGTINMLRWIGDPARYPMPSVDREVVAVLADDAIAMQARLDKLPMELFWIAGRALWVLGTERLGVAPLNVAGHILPKLVDQVAPIRDPGVVRLIARIAAQRAGQAAATAWLQANARHATPILEALSGLDDAKEAKPARAALELLTHAPGTTTVVDPEPEIASIFEELRKRLARVKKRDKQIELLRVANERYTEVRAAAGEATPEAYFTHRLGEFGLSAWGMLAVDAIEGGA
ncbi:MAG: hypothetical protein H0T89_32375 [Deltaproteobacteria bacterium]|nr:hypothetical protein [Deltaproteobacteria bacterium]MDQ3299380.1 hypothetical protein [Myxococcota bacterium]